MALNPKQKSSALDNVSVLLPGLLILLSVCRVESDKVCDDCDHRVGLITPTSCGRGERGLHGSHAGQEEAHVRPKRRDKESSGNIAGLSMCSQIRGEQKQQPRGRGRSLSHASLDLRPSLR